MHDDTHHTAGHGAVPVRRLGFWLRNRYDAVMDWLARVLIYPLERLNQRGDDRAYEREKREHGQIIGLTPWEFAAWCAALGMLVVFFAAVM